jgi:hypothetical protein
MFAFRRGGYKRESASGVFTPREHTAVGPAVSALREAAIVPQDLQSVGRDEHPVAGVGRVAAHARESRTRPIGAEGKRQLAGTQFRLPTADSHVLPIGAQGERQLAMSQRFSSLTPDFAWSANWR